MKLRIQKVIVWPWCFLFLFGFIGSGHGMVLCVGDDGHFEVETICLSYCDDEANARETDGSYNRHEGHSDCSNCSDVELGSSLWSKRIQNLKFNYSSSHDLNIPTNADFSFISVNDCNSRITKFHLAFGQGPPSYSIETTVLRC